MVCQGIALDRQSFGIEKDGFKKIHRNHGERNERLGLDSKVIFGINSALLPI